MDWGRSYTSRWRVYRVDARTWLDAGEVSRFDSASVDRTATGLLESATIKATRDVGEGFEEGYYRIALYAEQDGEVVRSDVATLLCSSSSGEVDRGRDVLSIDGRSVLYPASVGRLPMGTYAPMGCDGARFAADLLGECLAAPVSLECSFELMVHYVFDLGSTRLDAARSLLDAGGCCLQVDGTGTVHVLKLPTDPVLDLSAASAHMLAPGTSHADDRASVPNRYVANDGEREAVAVNADADSPVSTISRGYEHDYYDKAPKPVDGETLAAYARRRLRELSVSRDTRKYVREYWPGALPQSVVRCTMPDAGLSGDLRITRQALSLGYGVSVTEEAVSEVALWQG